MPLVTTQFPGSSIQEPSPPGSSGQSQPEVHLQVPEHDELLDVVDTLRSQGINHYIDLPQLIVCGDQSAGKSSVLEAISGGLRFPTKDTLCTRFAIELNLRRSPHSHISFTIVPYFKRTKEEIIALEKFEPPTTSLEEFPRIVDAAAMAMGVDGNRKSFSQDVLRVELSGPTQPHLTLVDLPGLYHAGNEHQSTEDAAAIHKLVREYMKKKRCIILAVVSAKNDYSNQIITKYAREENPSGDRTLGIITKPDTLDPDSSMQKDYKDLVLRDNGIFKLGWHVLRNRSYDTRNSSTAERDQAEISFFQREDWKSLPRDKVGIKALRISLSKVLLSHISRELPGLLSEVETGISNCEQSLQKLGLSRHTLDLQRSYLRRASQKFTTLIKNSVDGEYLDSFFDSSKTPDGYNRRLRAVVQKIMKDFAEEMRFRGHTVRIVDGKLPESHPDNHNMPPAILKDDFLRFVKEGMDVNRGTELPGIFNPKIINELFRGQSKPWEQIIHYARENLMRVTEATITLTLEYITDPNTARGVHLHLIQPRLEAVGKAFQEKTDEVLRPHIMGHPTTFNNYFIENIQKKRRHETRKAMAEKLTQFFGKDPDGPDLNNRIYNGQFNVRALLDSLVMEAEVEFDRFACLEATNAMEAYYEVALKTVVDAFGMYAVETSLLDKLPALFDPELVSELSDETVTKVAAESAESVMRRDELERKRSTLQQSLKTLQRLKIPKVPECVPEHDAPSSTPQAFKSSNSTVITGPRTPKKRITGTNKSSPSQDSAIGIDDEDEEDRAKRSERPDDAHEQVTPQNSAGKHLATTETLRHRYTSIPGDSYTGVNEDRTFGSRVASDPEDNDKNAMKGSPV